MPYDPVRVVGGSRIGRLRPGNRTTGSRGSAFRSRVAAAFRTYAARGSGKRRTLFGKRPEPSGDTARIGVGPRNRRWGWRGYTARSLPSGSPAASTVADRPSTETLPAGHALTKGTSPRWRTKQCPLSAIRTLVRHDSDRNNVIRQHYLSNSFPIGTLGISVDTPIPTGHGRCGQRRDNERDKPAGVSRGTTPDRTTPENEKNKGIGPKIIPVDVPSSVQARTTMLPIAPFPSTTAQSILDKHWGGTTANWSPMQLGNDTDARHGMRETHDGTRWFVKIRRKPVPETILKAIAQLHANGHATLVPVVPTVDGDLDAKHAGWQWMLQPWVDGTPLTNWPQPDSIWHQVGTAMRALHATEASETRHMPKETFESKWIQTVTAVDAHLQDRRTADTPFSDVSHLWRERSPVLQTLVQHVQTHGASLRRTPPMFAPTHGDLHGSNILVDTNRSPRIVDWDGLAAAPTERDLMFVLDVPAFWNGYGPANLNQPVLAWYRAEYVLQEIGDYAARIWLDPDIDTLSRTDAERELATWLESPGPVELASEELSGKEIPGPGRSAKIET